MNSKLPPLQATNTWRCQSTSTRHYTCPSHYFFKLIVILFEVGASSLTTQTSSYLPNSKAFIRRGEESWLADSCFFTSALDFLFRLIGDDSNFFFG